MGFLLYTEQMKILGNGWQVTVYEYGDSMVYKKTHKGFSAYMSILRDYPGILLTPQKIPIWVKRPPKKTKKVTQIYFTENRIGSSTCSPDH